MKLAKPLFAPPTSAIERIWYFALRIICVLDAAVSLSCRCSRSCPFRSRRARSSSIRSPASRCAGTRTSSCQTNGGWPRKNSFIVAPSATIVATMLGTLCRRGPHQGQFPRQGPAHDRAHFADDRAGDRGRRRHVPVFRAARASPNTYFGLIMAHAALGVPFVVTTVAATLQNFNYNLVRASQSARARARSPRSSASRCR